MSEKTLNGQGTSTQQRWKGRGKSDLASWVLNRQSMVAPAALRWVS